MRGDEWGAAGAAEQRAGGAQLPLPVPLMARTKEGEEEEEEEEEGLLRLSLG